MTTTDMDCSSKQFFTCFEDLANEIIYEIFEYFDFYYIYQTFSNLNNRYYNLINHSTFSIKLNLSSISTLKFENYYKEIIIPYQHRINSINIKNPFIFDHLFSPFHNLLQYPRLETLILENIESKILENFLQHSSFLSNLSSLIIIPIDPVQNKKILYYQIFRLPVLRYCKVSFKQHIYTLPLQISIYQYSPIKYLVINCNCHINDLNLLLSFLPQLCRLSCNNLSGSSIHHGYLQPVVVNNLTHLYLKIENIQFDEIELFFTNLSHQLQVFYLSTNYDITYINANRWEEFILSHMPNLRIFDIQLLSNNNSNQITSRTLINQFMTPFWFERQWFFRYEYEHAFTAFYSIKPYRRNNYTLTNYLYQDTYPCQNNINLNSVNHIFIRGNIETQNDFIHFPNITELTLFDYSNRSLHSISTIFDRIISLTKLNKLSIHCHHMCISQLIELLYFSPNIYVLTINSISLSKISSTSIQQSQTFQTISNENKIKNLIFKKDSTFECIQLFTNLCPRLEQLTIELARQYYHGSILESLTNIIRSHHVPFLCFLNINRTLSRTIESCLPTNCSIKSFEQELYIWS